MRKLKIITAIVFIILMAFTSITIGKSIYEDKEPTLGSFGTINFAGYLFFLTLPVEVLIPYYLSFDFSFTLIFIIAMITAMLSQMIDYAIGYLVPHSTVKEMIGEKRYKKSLHQVEKHARRIIFVFNLLPLSSPIVNLAAGVVGFNFKKTMFYNFLGLSLKYFIIIFAYQSYIGTI
jgi:membrane protein YqaA with SNARE-associated domain